MKFHKLKLHIFAIPICLLLSLAFSSKDLQAQEEKNGTKLSRDELFLKIKSASKAEITIEDGKYVSFLKDVAVEYIGISLTAQFATIASVEEHARFWGGVKVFAQDWFLEAEEATIDGTSAQILLNSQNGNVLFQLPRERLTVHADLATFLYIKDTGKPFKVKALGKVRANLEGQATLQTESAEYQFEQKLFKLGEEFTFTLSPELIQSHALAQLSSVEPSEVLIYGKSLEAKLVEQTENFLRAEFKGMKTQLKCKWGEVYAPELGMVLTRGNSHSEPSLQEGLVLERLVLSANEAEKVSGWLVDEMQRAYEFEALTLEAVEQGNLFILSGGVVVKGENFSFAGEEIIVEAFAPALSVRVPKRFRLNLSEKLVKEIGEELRESEESKQRHDQNLH